jgi:hypothetical protein
MVEMVDSLFWNDALGSHGDSWARCCYGASPGTKTVCVGGGPGYGFTVEPEVPFSITAGPLPVGDLQHAKEILLGWSIGGSGQSTPGRGVHGMTNPAGTLSGPSYGTPGASVSVTRSWCSGK